MSQAAKHRLVIAVAVGVGAWVWLVALPCLVAPDGSTGLSLLGASGGAVRAWATALAAAAPSLALALVVAATGHPANGVLCASASLCIAAARGGSIEGWWLRMEPGEGYLGLIGEVLMWQVILAMLIALIVVLRPKLRLGLAWLAVAVPDYDDRDSRLLHPHTWFATLASAAGAALLGWLLIPTGDVATSDTAQVIVGLIISFTLATLIAQLFLSQAGPYGMFFSPAILAIAVYAYVYFKFDNSAALLSAWQDVTLRTSQRLPGLAMALPIHYASAGVLGTALGIAWARTLMVSEDQAQDTSDPDIADARS